MKRKIITILAIAAALVLIIVGFTRNSDAPAGVTDTQYYQAYLVVNFELSTLQIELYTERTKAAYWEMVGNQAVAANNQAIQDYNDLLAQWPVARTCPDVSHLHSQVNRLTAENAALRLEMAQLEPHYTDMYNEWQIELTALKVKYNEIITAVLNLNAGISANTTACYETWNTWHTGLPDWVK